MTFKRFTEDYEEWFMPFVLACFGIYAIVNFIIELI